MKKAIFEQLNKKWFHTFHKDGTVEFQGQILEYDPYSEMCLVQYYEWIIGEPSTTKLIKLTSMENWELYNTDEEMRDAFTCKQKYVVGKT